MPAIRRRYHQGSVVLGANSHISDTKALCGKTVPVLMKDGETKNIPFGGFVNSLSGQRVKIIDITQFTDCELGWLDWQDLPPETIVVGMYKTGQIYVTFPLQFYTPKSD